MHVRSSLLRLIDKKFDFAGQKLDVAGRNESRQLRLNFTYRFGNKNIKAARQIKTGMEEEMNRTQSSGGLGH